MATAEMRICDLPDLSSFGGCTGTVKVWSLLTGREPIHRYQHNQKIQAMALSSQGTTVATASAFQVKLENANDQGYWKTAAEFDIQKLVSGSVAQSIACILLPIICRAVELFGKLWLSCVEYDNEHGNL